MGSKSLLSARSLLAAAVVALCVASTAKAQITNGLMANWPMNDGSGSTVTDASGNGFNGTLDSNSSPTWSTTGQINNASLAFTSTGAFAAQRVLVDNSGNNALNLDLTGTSFTVSVWADPSINNGSIQTLLFHGQNSNVWGNWGMGISGVGEADNTLAASKYVFYMRSSAADPVQEYVSSTGTAATNQWSLITAEYVNTPGNQGLYLYINGVLNATTTGACNLFTNGSPLQFGGDATATPDGYRGGYNGMMDDVGIWNRALSGQEIQAIYNAGESGKGLSTVVLPAPPIWKGGTSGDTWSAAANWNPSGNPSGAGVQVTFGDASSTGHGTVNLDANRTVGSITFKADVPTTITTSTSKVLTLDNTPFAATLTVAGNHTINTGVVLNSNVVETDSVSSDSLTISGVISDGGAGKSITMTGTGLLILSNNNTYSGGTAISSGTVQVGNGGATGSLGAGPVVNSGSLLFNRTGSFSASNISGTGSLTMAGAGKLTLGGNVIYTGPTFITGGTVAISTTTVAGLYEGLVSNSNGADTSDPIPQSSIQAVARWGASTISGGNNVYPAWANNTTWGYSGYLFNKSSAPVTYSFGKNFDDNGYLIIDGQSVINNTTWNQNVTGSITLGPGPHTVDLRFGQGSGGVGPNTGAYNNFGISYNSVLNTSTTGTWLQMGASDASTQFFATFAGAPGSAVIMSSNTTLDLSASNSSGLVALASLADASGSPTGHQVLIGGNTLYTGLDSTDTTFSGAILGNGGSLVKAGAGTFTLAGVNTYTGNTTVDTGTLEAVTVASLPGYKTPGKVSVAPGAVLAVPTGTGGWASSDIGTLVANATWGDSTAALGIDTSSADFTLSSGISKVLSLTKLGTNNLILTGSNSYAGLTTINSGAVQVGNGGITGTLGAGAVINNSSLVFNRSDNFTVGNSISGPGTLTKLGAGKLTLSGVLNYSGNTILNSGTIVLNSPPPTGLFEGLVSAATGADTTDPIPQTSIQPVARWGATTAGSSPAGNNIFPTDPGGTGWANTTTWGYSGYLDNTSSGSVTYTFGKNFDDNGYLTIDHQSVINNTTWNQNVTGQITLGPGLHSVDLRFGQGGGGVGPNTGAYNSFGISYNTVGNTATTGTWLQMGASDPNTQFFATNAWGAVNSSIVMSSNTTLDLSGTSVFGNVAGVGSLADASGSPTGHRVLLGANTLETGFDNSDTQFSGAIVGSGGLIKTGAGNFTFSGASTFTGATAVNNGTLTLSGLATLATSPSITIASGATLDSTGLAGGLLTRSANQSLGGGGTLNGNLTATGATITPLPGGSLTVNKNTVLNSGTVLNLGIGDGTGQLLNLSGLNINGATTVNVPLLNFVDPAGSYQIINNNGIAITGANHLSLSAVTVRGEALDITTDPSVVNVTVGNPANLTWVGKAGSNIWDVNGNKNWNNTTSGTNPDVFYNMDSVTFDDSGVAVNGGTVTLVGSLAPTGSAGFSTTWTPTNAVIVNVSAPNAYTFAGTGSIVGATSLSKSGDGTLNIANTNSFGGIDPSYWGYGIVSIHQGKINVMPGGVLTNNTTEIDVGDIPGQTGILSMSSGTAIVPLGSNDNSGVNVGYSGGTGVVTLAGNSLLDASAYSPPGYYNVVAIGFNNGTAGSSGTVTVGGTSTLKAVNGSQIQVGFGGNGVLTVQDQALVQTDNFFLGTSGGTGTLYLNGGTLSVPSVQANNDNSGAMGKLYFNGGTLQANAASTDFITGGAALTTYVQKGGAVIDSNGNNITITQPLSHDAALGKTVDGGLTKTGAGTLILTGSNNYTGATNITGGVLRLAPNQAAPLVYRLDPSSASNYTLDGSGNVTQLNDLSGNGNNFVGTSSAVTITNLGSAFNNLNVMSFSYASSSTLTLNNSTSPKTVFIVEQVTNSNSGDDGIFGATGADEGIRIGSNNGSFYIYNPGNTNDFTNNGGAIYLNGAKQPGNASAGSPQLLEAYAGSLSASPAPWGSTSLGHSIPGYDRFFDGYIGEVLAYNVALSDSQREQVEAYLEGKWFGGTAAPLPTFSTQPASAALPATDVNMSAGTTLDLNDNIVTIGALNGLATAQVLLGSGTNGSSYAQLSVGANNNSGTMAGSISGIGALIKIGSGTQVLSGSNTYSGNTTVNSGVLKAGAINTLSPNSGVIISGGTLEATGYAQTIQSLTMGALGSLNLSFGNVLTTTYSGSLTGTLNLFGALPGPVELIGFTSSYSGSFSVVNGIPTGYSLKYLPTELALLAPPSVWASAVSGNWSTAGNWTGPVPNAAFAGAIINQPTSSPLTVTIDAPQTIGTLVLGNSLSATTGYTLSGSGSNTLTFNSMGGGGTITVTDGTHAINAPVVLADSLVVISGGTNPWTLSFGAASSITGSDKSVTMNGAGGTLILNGANNYSGGTIVNAGALQIGSGATGAIGPVNVNGGTTTIASGTSVALPTVNVSGGQLNLGHTATPVGAFNVTGGAVNVGSGASAAVVTLPTSGANVAAPAGQELTVTSKLTNNSDLTIVADATHPFMVGGANLVGNIDSLIVQGGTTTVSQGQQSHLFTFASPTTQAQASSYYSAGDRGPWHTIDGSGLSGTVPNQTGGNSPNSTEWRTDAPSPALPPLIRLGGSQDAWIAYNFGSPVILVQAQIWNYNQISSTYSSRGIQYADISVSNSPAAWADGSYTNAAWTPFSQNTTNYPSGWPEANGSGADPGFWDTLDFNGANGQYLRLNNLASFVNDPNGLKENNVAGLSEIEFYVLNALNHPNTKVVAASGTTSTLDLSSPSDTAILGDLQLQSGSELAFRDVAGVSFKNITGPSGSTLDASIPLSLTGGTMAGVIQGAGSLTMVGPGTLVLSGTNTYSGGTDVVAGTLDVTTPAALLDGSSLSVGTGLSAFPSSAVAAPAVASPSSVSAVPEPGTLALLAVGGLVAGFAVWRRRKNA